MASAVFLVVPNEISQSYASLVIVANVIPGLMLTGSIKLLNLGLVDNSANLVAKIIASFLLSFLVCVLVIFHQKPGLSIAFLGLLVATAASGSIAQPFSSVWFYIQPNNLMLLIGKSLSLCVRVGFSAYAILEEELIYVLIYSLFRLVLGSLFIKPC